MARYDFAGEEQRRIARRRQQMQTAEALDRQVTPQMAARAIQLAQSFPHTQAGTVQSLVSTGANDEEAVALASVDDGGGFSPFDVLGRVMNAGFEAVDKVTFGLADRAFNQVWQRAAMPTLRGAFVAFDSLYREVVEAPIVAVGTSVAEAVDRSPLHDALFRGEDLVQGAGGERASLNPFTNYQQYGRSAGFRFAQGLLDGPGGQSLDLGRGIITDPESEIGSMVRADHRLRVRGEEAGIGNFSAAAYMTPIGFSPGDTAYDFVSGLQQFAAEVLGDPATLLLAGSPAIAKGAARLGATEGVETAIRGGISGARARARATEVDEFRDVFRRIQEVRDDAGNVIDPDAEQAIWDEAIGLVNRNGNSRQRTVLPEKALPWGQRHDVVEEIAKRDPYDLRQTWKRRGPARLKGEVIGELGTETDPSKVAEIITREITEGYLKERGFYTPSQVAWRETINETKLASFSDMASTGVMPADDLWAASGKAETFMEAGNVPVEGYARVRVGDDTAIKLADEVTEADDVIETFGGRRHIINKILTLEPGDIRGMTEIVDEMLTTTKFTTPEWGGGQLSKVDWDSAQRFVHQWRDETNRAVARLQRFNTDQMGRPVPSRFDKVAMIEGEEIRTWVPHLASEGKQLSDVMLPDIIDLRRAAVQNDTIRRLYQSSQWDSVARRARWFTSSVFKPLVLFRLAYIARTLPDDQARMHFRGYESMFDGPYSYIVGNVTNQRAARGLTGGRLADRPEHARLMGLDLNPRQRMERSEEWAPIFKQENVLDEVDEAGEVISRTYSDEYLDAWHTEQAQIATDDASRYLLDNPHDFDGLRAWLLSDDLNSVVSSQRTGRESLRGLRMMWGDEVEDVVRRGGAEWEDLARSWQERIELKFAGEVGRPVPIPLRDAALQRGDDFKFGIDDIDGKEKARRFLGQFADDYGPVGLKRELPPDARGRGGVGGRRREQSKLRDIVDTVGDLIVRKPSAYFSRNPLWRQAIARNLEGMMPSISREMRQEVVEKAKDLQVSDDWMARLRKAADEAEGDGFIDDIRQIEEEAIAQATFQVEDLLFDINTRSAMQENHEVFVPFIDAWRESIEIWSGIVRDHPEVVTRGMSIFRGGESSGFIHTNENGERMFTVPNPTPALRRLVDAAQFAADPTGQLFDAQASDRLFGPDTGDDIAMRLPARVEAVNLVFSSVGPGFGPVVQWPVAAFAPKNFEDSGLGQLIMPFGSELDEPGDITDPMALARQLAPAWARKVLNTTGRWDELQYQSTVNEALQAIEATGDYDLSDPLERKRMEQDAKRSAQWLLLVRGLAHGTLPAGPGGEWRLRVEATDPDFEPEPWNPDEDPDGKWYTIAQMAQEYKALADELGDFDLATKQFIQQFGYEPHLLSLPLTRTFGPRPTDMGGAQWMAENGELVEAHPHVAGYFAPRIEDDDPFNGYGRWREQIEAGTREVSDPQLQIALSQRAKAYQMYNNFQKMLPSDLPQRDRDMRLAIVRGALDEEFPGWLNPVNSVGATKLRGTGEYIDEFRAVATDPRLADNPVAQRVRLYLTVRDEALRRFREQVGDPRATLGRREAEQVREALSVIGTHIKEADGSGRFVGPWRILARELEV